MEKARLILLAAALGIAACAGRNVQTMSYATVAEARGSGAVDQGWVPAVLPEGAYELRAAYDTSGWRRWGLFNFHDADANALRAELDQAEKSLEGVEIDIPGRIEWWPVALRGRLNAERLATTGLRAYLARRANMIVAVNWNQRRAYYWTIGP